jgi:DNA polymerase-3 subunit alpha
MQISSVIAGFSLGEADILRRAMGKKIPGVMDERRKAFIEGAIKNNVPEETARKLFDLMVPFAGYGFNKSHSAGYALLSYQTAWLKANYPAQFMASTLTSEFQDTDRIKVLIDECKRMKLKVLPPDVNLSDIDFRTKSEDEKEADSDAVPARTANSIRFGLATIKNLGKTAASQCVKGKPFKSFSDFMNRTNLNRKACESLIKAGAFDRFNSDRRELLDLVDVKNAAQLTLFAREKEPVKEGWQKAELLAWEKESFGFYFSGHPLEKHRDEVQAFVTASADDIPARGADEEVVIGGIVARKKSVGDKGTTFVSIEDFTGIVEIVGFSDVQEIMSLKIEDEILVKGRVSHRNGRSSVRASQIVPLSKIRKDYIRWVDVWIHILGLEESTLEELHKLFVETPGDCNVFLHMVGEKKEEVVLRMELKIMPKRSLCTKVRKLFGQSSIKLGGPPL